MSEIINLTTTIADGASLSGSLNIAGLVPVAVVCPAGWDTADITLQASLDGTTYYDVYKDDDDEYTLQAGASRYVVFTNWQDFIGVQELKLRSGTTGTPVNQSGDVVLTLVCRPV